MKVTTAGYAFIGRSKFVVVVEDAGKTRIYSYPISNDATQNQAELYGVEFAALGSTPGTEISVSHSYIFEMFRKDGDKKWLKTPKHNKDEIDRIRVILDEKHQSVIIEKGTLAREMTKLTHK